MKRQFRRTAAAFVTAGAALALLAGCGAPTYLYAADNADHAYFKVPSSWQQVSPDKVAAVQTALLNNSAAGSAGGSFIWSRAYSDASKPALTSLLVGSHTPAVYASVQSLKDALRSALSFDEMRDLLFPVTSQARQNAAANGENIAGFALVSSTVISLPGGIHGINELYEFNVGGLPDAFDQTVLTNSDTTKLYLLLVQCYQDCFASHSAQIKAVVQSFTVRGS
ncbi:MAG TPA: hypothetical protein VEV45_13250 [Streptosporangiaceae bacterium]|nr:hypothetical protein [Streptosporangiaceae bacterium]